jgi:hypothetical protein
MGARVRLARPARGAESARGTVVEVLDDEEGTVFTVGVLWDDRSAPVLFLIGDLVTL